jgi:DNA-binding IclR family transcriptional regulator
MHCTASGKAMLSNMPFDEVEEIIRLRGLSQVTQNTITDEKIFFDELEKTRIRGYAVDKEEETVGVCCVATAICDSTGKAVGALSVSAPKISIVDETIVSYAKLLGKVSNILSQNADLFPTPDKKRSQ